MLRLAPGPGLAIVFKATRRAPPGRAKAAPSAAAPQAASARVVAVQQPRSALSRVSGGGRADRVAARIAGPVTSTGNRARTYVMAAAATQRLQMIAAARTAGLRRIAGGELPRQSTPHLIALAASARLTPPNARLPAIALARPAFGPRAPIASRQPALPANLPIARVAVANLAGPRRAMVAALPARHGAAPGFSRTVRAAQAKATAGDVYLDKTLVGYRLAAAITAEQSRAAARPNAASASFNTSMAVLRPSGFGAGQ